MPKKKKSATKRTVTCGKCKQEGHNARTCKTESVPEPVAKMIYTSEDIPPPPVKPGSKRRIDYRTERREAPTAGKVSANDYASYSCPKCNQVAILVVVRIRDHGASFRQGRDVYVPEFRCEECFNKPPADLILKWGAEPNEKITLPDENNNAEG